MRLIAALLVCLACAAPALAGRVALVMGNGDYVYEKPLRNAANDARDMAGRLRAMAATASNGRRGSLRRLNRARTFLQSAGSFCTGF